MLMLPELLPEDPNAKLDDGVEWLENLVKKLQIPRLSSYKITRNDFPAIAEKALLSSSMKGNPIKLSETELIEILEISTLKLQNKKEPGNF